MTVRKLRRFDDHSAGLTIPRDQLRQADLLDEDGHLQDELYVRVELAGDEEWELSLIEG